MTHFGTTKKGEDVERVTITAGVLYVSILTFGAIVQDVRLSDVPRNLTLGSEALADYEAKMGYFGAIIGPIANRISNARVRLDGMMYELERNENGQTHLHSGADGCHRKVWRITAQTTDSVTLGLSMPDGAAGLPGQREISVTYSVSAPATLTMTIDGATDTTNTICLSMTSFARPERSPRLQAPKWIFAKHEFRKSAHLRWIIISVYRTLWHPCAMCFG